LVVQPVRNRRARIDVLLIEMRAEQDVKRRQTIHQSQAATPSPTTYKKN
jgi:hypothetical protein